MTRCGRSCLAHTQEPRRSDDRAEDKDAAAEILSEPSEEERGDENQEAAPADQSTQGSAHRRYTEEAKADRPKRLPQLEVLGADRHTAIVTPLDISVCPPFVRQQPRHRGLTHGDAWQSATVDMRLRLSSRLRWHCRTHSFAAFDLPKLVRDGR